MEKKVTFKRMNKIPILLLLFGEYTAGRISDKLGNNTLILYYSNATFPVLQTIIEQVNGTQSIFLTGNHSLFKVYSSF